MTRIIEECLELILTFDQDGNILYGNTTAKKELGYDEGFLGVNIHHIFRNEKKTGDALSSGEKVEAVAYRKNQTCFPVQLKVSVVPEGAGFHGVCMAVNIGLQKEAIRNLAKAQEDTKDADKSRNEFVANVTHELRTPVNGILGHTRNLLETNIDKDQKNVLKIIESCCENMQKIINNLLDFSKLESGKFELEEKSFCFREIIDRIMSLNITQISDKGLRLIVNIAPEVPEHVISDELFITQIINNLISNATKFTEQGQIVVNVVVSSIKDDNLELFFMVIDTGIGITEEEKSKLFKSFSQADASITRKYGGTGLGLCIVKQMVEHMGGTIQVESEKGKGSTFSFSLKMKIDRSNTQRASDFSSGAFVYDGNTKRKVEELTKEEASRLKLPVFNQDGTLEVNFEQSNKTADHMEDIEVAMEKLDLCMEMDNWEKAEMFAGQIKKMINKEDKDIYQQAFRLEMSVRKGDLEKSSGCFEKLREMLKGVDGYEG